MAKSFVIVDGGYPRIDPGRMRHRIKVLAPGSYDPLTFDAAGPVSTPVEFCSAWAAIEVIRGSDLIRSGQVTSQTFLIVGMWFQPGIASNMQVQHPNGSVYVVQNVENVMEMDVVLVLNCVALGANS